MHVRKEILYEIGPADKWPELIGHGMLRSYEILGVMPLALNHEYLTE